MEQYFCNPLAEPNNNNYHLSKYLIDKCNAIRSCDFRLSNLVLYKLTQQPYNDDILKFCFYEEIFWEIDDDLRDYEKDVLKNTFNIYRMYVNLYGNNSELHFKRYIREIEAQLSEQFNYLSIKYPEFIKRRREILDELIIQEITPTKFYITQNWDIPKPILDEHSWRTTRSNELLKTKGQSE
ncbi:unnamed protein product [Rotaria sp. Silwood1]|nr:unnamed protein product [Rotaria sp. Silwood1]